METESTMNWFECPREKWVENEETFINSLNNSSWKTLPSINQVDLSTLKDGQLVRFTGMVQDMRSPGYYFERYVIINKETNEKTLKCGRFMEFIKCEENETFDENDSDTIRKEFQPCYVISTPAENEWVRAVEAKHTVDKMEENVATCSGGKRVLEGDDELMDTEGTSQCTDTCRAQKRQCTNTSTSNETKPPEVSLSADYLLNFPIPNKYGKGCIIKVYDYKNDIKLNNIYEFVGFLSINPHLSHECHSNEESAHGLETQIHNPSPSLIPRIHCLAFKKLNHGNPLVEGVEFDRQKFENTRKEIILILTQLLLGDEIAAEYFLCCLISEVYVRKHVMALGKFSVNLSNIPTLENMNYVEKVYEFIESFIPKSHYFPLTIENLNEVTIIPKKDYEGDRLNSGLLQLSANTVVVLDETKLEPGKLSPAGLEAIKAISDVLKNQKLSYDFGYYPIDFDCDIPFIVMSVGKSMLQSDCHVVLKPTRQHVETFSDIIDALKLLLKPELLDEIRKYLTLSRLVSYNLEEHAHALIQNKFIEMRQNGANADDLHNLLVLNRLICLSYGKNSLDGQSWEIASRLEAKRKQRLR